MTDLIEREALNKWCHDTMKAQTTIIGTAYIRMFWTAVNAIPTITPESLVRQEQQNTGCKFCTTVHEDWSDGGAHDFRLHGNSLFYFDHVLGWEGTRIKFCPMCGRKLGLESEQ